MPVERRRGTKTVYYAVFTWRGKRVWENAGTDKREAERLEQRRKREVKAGTYVPPAESRGTTVGQWITSWAERRNNRAAEEDRRLVRNHIAPTAFASLPIAEVRPRHCVAFIEELQAAGRLAPKSIANAWGLVKTAFRDATIAEIVPSDPCVIPRGLIKRVNKTERGIYTAEELQRLLACSELAPDAAMFVALCVYTGMREGEVCGLRWGDYDREAGTLTLSRSYDDQPLKTERTRVIPVHSALVPLLEEWRRSGFELVTRRSPFAGTPIVPIRARRAEDAPQHHTKSSAYKLWRRACAAAGVDNRSLHSTRHSFITHARRGGANVDALERVTHNARGEIIDRYTHWQIEPLRAAVECFKLGSCRSIVDPIANTSSFLAPAPGLEPGTRRLTAACSTN